MSDRHWERWIMQTARTWEDLAPVIKETGISGVDKDHRVLAEYILELNELLMKLDKEFSLEIVEEQRELFNKFQLYTRVHFHREESFLEKYKLPGIQKQRDEHKKILKMLEKIIFDFNTGRISSAFKLRIQLLDWIVDHINNTDFVVFDFVNICESLLELESWNDISGFIRNIHVPPLDRDHKYLTESIIKLGQKIRFLLNNEGAETDKLLTLFDETLVITEKHFNREENIIRKFRIPEGDVQNQQHNKFVNYLKTQREIIGDGDRSKLPELEQELLFWWIQHINVYDYKTFRKTDWIGNVFTMANMAEDVLWLINKTGIEQIDNDHWNFIELLFELKYIIDPEVDQTNKQEECLEEMKRVIEYARGHFLREEAIMENRHSKDLENHKKEHDKILTILEEHYKGIETGMINLSVQLREKLMNWWIDHTNGVDYETFGAEYD